MGLKGFVAWLREHHKEAFIPIQSLKRSVFFDHLYLDFNQILYRAARNVEVSGDDGYQQVLKHSGFCLKRFVNREFKAGRLIYVAIDGPAPVAKIALQQSRRTEHAHEAEMHGLFDSQQITPGTKFMGNLERFLKTFAQQHVNLITGRYGRDLSYIIDGPTRPGEGESKIGNFIKASTTMESRGIIASDSDVYLHSLFWTKPNCYIIDYAQQISLFSADVFKSRVGKYALDYYVLCMMSGTDYGPPIKVANYRFTLPQFKSNPMELTKPEQRSLNLENLRHFARCAIRSPSLYGVGTMYETENEEKRRRDPWKLRQNVLTNLRYLRWVVDLLLTGHGAEINHFSGPISQDSTISLADIATIDDTDLQAFQTQLDQDGKHCSSMEIDYFSTAVSLVALLTGTTNELATKYIPAPLLPLHEAFQKGKIGIQDLPAEIAKISSWSEEDLWCLKQRSLTTVGSLLASTQKNDSRLYRRDSWICRNLVSDGKDQILRQLGL